MHESHNVAYSTLLPSKLIGGQPTHDCQCSPQHRLITPLIPRYSHPSHGPTDGRRKFTFIPTERYRKRSFDTFFPTYALEEPLGPSRRDQLITHPKAVGEALRDVGTRISLVTDWRTVERALPCRLGIIKPFTRSMTR
jgi:hypothetical protein